jgi:hypothetical protein
MSGNEDDRVAHRAAGSNSNSLFQLGPILGGLALIGVISIGAYFYRQNLQLLESYIALRTEIAQLRMEFKKSLDETQNKNNGVLTGVRRVLNNKIERVNSQCNYIQSYCDDQIETLKAHFSGTEPPKHPRRSVRLPDPLKPAPLPNNRPRPAPRPGGKPPPEPIIDFNDPDDDEQNLQDDIDDFTGN